MGERLTYYDLIGVPPDASAEEIKAAMRRNLRYWHPDRNARPDALERTKAITKAFATLSDPLARAQYDRSLEAFTADFDLHEDVHDGRSPSQPPRRPAARPRARPRAARARPTAGSQRPNAQYREPAQPVQNEQRGPRRAGPLAFFAWLYRPFRSPLTLGTALALAARVLAVSALVLAGWIAVEIALYVASIIVPIVAGLLMIAALAIVFTAGSPKRKRGRRRRR